MVLVVAPFPGLAPDLDRTLRDAVRRVGLLGAVTPLNRAEEHERLALVFARGERSLPSWRYTRADVASLRASLSRVDAALAATVREEPLAELYRARTDELAQEVALIEAVGRPGFGERAALRFPSDGVAGAKLAASLADERSDETSEPTCTSDGDEPASLASRLRAAIGAHRMAFRVELREGLLPLAATGDGVVLVAVGRRLTDEAARRTTLHEIEGHALPRHRASKESLALFALGTAHGADNQEGYALLLERRAGFLRGARTRELSARHRAVVTMRGGADFAECTTALLESGSPLNDALRIAERTYRGGDGKGAGLGREVVYLEALARVEARLAAHPEDEPILASGQVSIDAVTTLRRAREG